MLMRNHIDKKTERLNDIINVVNNFKRQAEADVMRDVYFKENPSNIIGFCDAVLELIEEQKTYKASDK